MMLSCEQVVQEIWAYLDRDLEGEVLIHVQTHLELCRACFSRCEFERMLREAMQKRTHHTCPEVLRNRIKKILDQF